LGGGIFRIQGRNTEMSINSSDLLPGFVSFILYLYGLGIAVFAVWFNYRYAIEAGFVKWVFFGEVIATAKAIIWPYFIFVARG
jgi:hypothetical protein